MTATRFLGATLVALAAACSSPVRNTPAPNPEPSPPIDAAPSPQPVPMGESPPPDAGSVSPPPADSGSPPAPGPGPGGDAGAVVPSPTGAPAMALETVQVPASGEAVMVKSLAMGELFLLKAAGSIDFGAQKVDAEFGFGGGMPADEAGGVDLGVDVGLPQIHPMVHNRPTPPGPGRMKWYTYYGYRDDHVYYMVLTGAGQPVSLKLAKPAGASAGSGSISVSVLQLSPAPPKALGTERETVTIPVTMTIVMSTMTTEAGKLYVLQAAGAGKVGGGGTHLGDADYMDWAADGTGANEGEAGADFGIGVDETQLKLMPYGPGGYKPRVRWWGPWRMDHTYYMTFVGTGKPIQFLYFDSGYGDNSPTDKLTVKIFDVP
jgi:hypothetical protein